MEAAYDACFYGFWGRGEKKIMPFFRCENITPFYKFGICNAPFGIAIICL
jgi:hypothetical protein